MRQLFILFLLTLSLSSFAQDKSCVDFQTATFVYADKDRPVTISRADNKQVEINRESGLEIHSSIEWISDCEYVLTIENIVNHPKDVSRMIGRQIPFEIVSVLGDRVTVQSKSGKLIRTIEYLIIE